MTRGKIGVGVLGLGFMGRTHIVAYQQAADDGIAVELRAVCDPSAARRAGELSAAGNIGAASEGRLFDPEEVQGYENPEELFADAKVDLVSICTPTDSHVDLAIQAIEAGKHVLVEKPVSLTAAEIERLEQVRSNHPGIQCMPAMCIRFWPGWRWLRDRIADGRYGGVVSASFERVGGAPNWSQSFYADPSRSGSALFDLHVHDVDFLYWCFGPPRAVTSVGSALHLTTLYHFDETGPAHVTAEGGWLPTHNFPFRMRYRVAFENAVAEYDLSHEVTLQLITEDGIEPIHLEDGAGYDHEIRHLIRAIQSGQPLGATLSEAAAVTRLIEAERLSLETQQTIKIG